MPDALHLKPEEMDTTEKRGKYAVNIVGCGQRGIRYALEFLGVGFKVVGADADQSIIKRLSRGKILLADRGLEARLKNSVRTGMLSFTSDVRSAVAQSDIIVITISAKIDAKKNADFSEIETACKQVGAGLRRGVLVVYVGVGSFGLIEGIIKEILENTSGLKAGEDFGLAYNPVLFFDEDDSLNDEELIVAAGDKTSLDGASIILATLTRKGIKQILDFKTAELAALFAGARRDANVALSNEFAMLCENAGKDYFEILEITDVAFHGTDNAPTISEEHWRDEAYLLLENAENLNAKLRLTAVARQTNENMARYAANLVQDTLRSCGKTIRRARVALLGEIKPKASGDEFVRMLEAKGAKITRYDSLQSRNDVSTTKRNLIEAVEGSDCIVILKPDREFKGLNLKKLKAVMRAPAAIIDLAGIMEPEEIRKEGFIYRGLGRGSEKK